MNTPQTGDLRVWYIPQIPGKPLFVSVPDYASAKLVADALVALSNYELVNNIKLDYSDALGVQWYEDDDWYDIDDEEWDVES